ncbi:hypothetical protein PENVUL_c016G08296 [Penicillium vulpinum]|uniref:Uncharacterized protein n=1 Tax=Penicillium vulpinum TaxID=29845 RepID=A0A1V6RYD3_9EURO|nr:hypothetical protein PENVUL_c016G08296 [Penicillium vulpinum]
MTILHETIITKTDAPRPLADNVLATSPSAPQDLPCLLEELQVAGASFLRGDTDERLQVVHLAQSIVHAMRTPRETVLQYSFAQFAVFSAIEICIDLGIFSILTGSNGPKTAQELAEETGTDASMLARILKHLAAMMVIVETGPDEYKSNSISQTLAVRRYSDMWPCAVDCIRGAAQALPTWLKQNAYQSPTNGIDCPFTTGYNTKLAFYEWLHANPHNPSLASQFAGVMSAYRQNSKSWMDGDSYPLHDRLICEARTGKDDVFLVDVGGSVGHDLLELRRKWPSLPGKLILQDLPAVVENVGILEDIQVMAYDFFTTQPRRRPGARVYYLHSILHNWNDEKCRQILAQLAAAMAPSYSVLLIHDNVIPDMGAHWEATAMDIMMMVNVAAKERTRDQWSALLESEGLTVGGIWTLGTGVESLVECRLSHSA